MRAGLLMVALAGLSFGAVAAAEPAKAPVQKASQPTPQNAEVVVASAENIKAEATGTDRPEAAPAKKPRRARVISCRCGEQPEGE